MRRLVAVSIGVLLAVAAVAAGYHASEPSAKSLSKDMPPGAMLFLEARDFGALLNAWNQSPEKNQWVASSNYEVFSRSRLFLRLKAASDQFANAAGVPPDMNFVGQVAGDQSALAIYDIGNLQFLYVTHLASARSAETLLWKTRSKFEQRSVGSSTFYLRRDPESQREVAFAVSGDYLLLATREDLMAQALQLMGGSSDRTIESEPWWTASVAAAGERGDLRMVLDLGKIVPSPYFRTYWVQQNITEMKQYSAAVSDLYREGKEYREERVLIRKEAGGAAAPQEEGAGGSQAVADVVRLVPENAGLFEARANPLAENCTRLITQKLLAPAQETRVPSQIAPQVQLGSGETGSGADLETRIDEPLIRPAAKASGEKAVEDLMKRAPILASLEVQSSARENVFVATRTAVVFFRATEWNAGEVESAILETIRPQLTAGELGTGWQSRSGYRELDGLWPLAVAVRGKYLLVANQGDMLQSLLANFDRPVSEKAADFVGGFRHDQERGPFAQWASIVDRPFGANAPGTPHQPQFFADNVASVSATLRAVASEKVVVRSEIDKVRQTVTYQWSR